MTLDIGEIFITILNIIDLIAMYFVMPYIALLVFKFFIPVRESRWSKPVLYIGFYIFTATSIVVGDPVNIFGAVLVLFITVMICCYGTFLQRIAMVLVFSSFSLSINALIDTYLRYNIELLINLNFSGPMYYGILRAMIWLAVYFSLKRFKPESGYYLPPKLWLLVDILTLAPFATTLITVAMNGYIEENNIAVRTFLLLTIATLTSYGLLWEIAVLAQNQKLEQEKSFYEMNRMYYKNLEQEQYHVRQLRHDMANHLQTMSVMPEPELHNYLNQLIKSPAIEHTQRFCENNVVNIVLASKKAVMDQNNITSEINVTVPKEIPVKDAELCAVFANSLDNAIEACEKLPESQKHVSIKAVVDKGLFVLQVQNPLKTKLIYKDGLPITAKQNKDLHGFGLKSLRKIAEKYGGFLEASSACGKFSLLVCLHLG